MIADINVSLNARNKFLEEIPQRSNPNNLYLK